MSNPEMERYNPDRRETPNMKLNIVHGTHNTPWGKITGKLRR